MCVSVRAAGPGADDDVGQGGSGKEKTKFLLRLFLLLAVPSQAAPQPIHCLTSPLDPPHRLLPPPTNWPTFLFHHIHPSVSSLLFLQASCLPLPSALNSPSLLWTRPGPSQPRPASSGLVSKVMESFLLLSIQGERVKSLISSQTLLSVLSVALCHEFEPFLVTHRLSLHFEIKLQSQNKEILLYPRPLQKNIGYLLNLFLN